MKNSALVIGFRIGFLLLVMGLLRICFIVNNAQVFSPYDWTQIFHSFLLGAKFDLAALCLINAPVILLSLFTPLSRLTSGVFILINTVFLAPNIVDMEYFKYTGTRMTWDVLLLKNEAGHQAGQFVRNFWHLSLIFMLMILALIMFERTLRRYMLPKLVYRVRVPWLKELSYVFIVISCTVVAARGGFSRKAMQPVHAYDSDAADLGILTLNSTFTLIKSPMSPVLRPVYYFATDEEARQKLPAVRLDLRSERVYDNVVIIILESFASEFWGAINEVESYTPFLDELAKKSLFFKNNFANGRRSIEALPAILFGIPSYMDTPVFRSNYQNNRWKGLGTVLSDHGYHTSFFHGAAKGTMYFDAISKVGGLTDYHPLERYPKKSNDELDGHWGVFDGPMLQYMANELNKQPQPFFSVVFTLSTHQPYSVPKQYKESLPKGTLDIHQSVAYVDLALKEFFATASKMPWYQNTLFVITGDHTQMSQAKYYNTILGRFRVPLLLYHPTKKLAEVNKDRITQHVDVFPTVLDYLGIKELNLPLFGRSVFDTQHAGRAVFHSNGHYWLVQDDYFLDYFEGHHSLLYDFRKGLESLVPLSDQLDLQNQRELEVKAYVQYFRNGLIYNSIFSAR